MANNLDSIDESAEKAAQETADKWLEKLLGILTTAHGASTFGLITAILNRVADRMFIPWTLLALGAVFGLGLAISGGLMRALQSWSLSEIDLMRWPSQAEAMEAAARHDEGVAAQLQQLRLEIDERRKWVARRPRLVRSAVKTASILLLVGAGLATFALGDVVLHDASHRTPKTQTASATP